MKSLLALTFGIYLICSKPAFAVSDLVTRQTCDEFYCTDWDFGIKSIGDATSAASQWLDFSQTQNPDTAPAPDTDPTDPQDSQVLPAPKNPAEPQTDSETWIQAPPPELTGCQTVAPSSNSDAKDNLVSHSFKLLCINGTGSQYLTPSGVRTRIFARVKGPHSYSFGQRDAMTRPKMPLPHGF